MASGTTPESAERATPDWLFKKLDELFRFGLDAAATAENAKCAKYLTKTDDALSTPWQGYGPVFLNPPYSRGQLALWLKKTVEEAAKGTVVVTVLPGDFGTRWFATVWSSARFILFLGGRVKFNGISSAAKFPTVIAVFGPPELTAYPSDCPCCTSRLLASVAPGSKVITNF